MRKGLKGNILITVIVMGFMLAVLLVPAVVTISRLIKIQGVSASFVAQEEALASGIDYARYLVSKGLSEGTLQLPQGTVEVMMNPPNTVGNTFNYYDVLITYRPQAQTQSAVVWVVKLVEDSVNLASWVVSIEGSSG